MKKKYSLHPGWITSKTDGQQHFIRADQLVRLYGVKREECFVWNEYGSNQEKAGTIALHPRYDGNYSLPTIRAKIASNEGERKI